MQNIFLILKGKSLRKIIEKIFLKLKLISPYTFFFYKILYPLLQWCVKRSKTFSEVLKAIVWQEKHYNTPRISHEQLSEWKQYDPNYYLSKDGNFDSFYKKFRTILDGLIKDVLNKKTVTNIVEIGCMHGKLLASYAKTYPNSFFYGVDFNVDYAKKNIDLSNIKFRNDYWFDFLSDEQVSIDLLFCMRTLEFFTPKELELFVEKCFLKKVKYIIAIEELILGQKIKPEEGKKSSVNHEQWWFHNYPAYFKEGKYDIYKIKTEPINHPHRGEHKVVSMIYKIRD